ncbi:hypothetical protein JCM9140_49 [Halalkalibacter wakoensis JCM 9140]|uniref:Putative cysteine ligase BshC n=1 Tax=Halalkalibacter wakoensis JCM 9140 TaxID=1236970 RepID=W4PWR8_9BACI|nr:bacillithiol biosynthesis cysteine-adding enzyme BshC [Halalkalibacter wakoensis]GAE24140.1 hypothetical protein JCM9140_49 [Halalkalibacter wakoensis JCM 9140]
MLEVKDIDLLSETGFIRDYVNGHLMTKPFFDFTYTDEEKFHKRVDDLHQRAYKREELAEYFTRVHTNLPHAEVAHEQIKKLKQENSVVVVGGQQAGLLTGPLYTVYKAMSILILAKQQEERLNVPVVPIFWIAGEDHDIDEIRFVYKEKSKRWKKHVFHPVEDASSASTLLLNKMELKKWVEELFATFPETAHTNYLHTKLISLSDESVTFVDFFRNMMNWIFGKEGLLLLDAHDPEIRKLEINYFEKLIDEVEHVQLNQQKGALAFAEAGYGEPIVTEPLNAHLFLEVDGERKRVDYENGEFYIKGTNLHYSKEQLKVLVKENPERFSNNVVTRPLMQEWLLPVLAFISGPGELRYWATLKHVFSHFDLNVPPVIPRIQMTFIPAHIQKWLSQNDYDVRPFLMGEMEQVRECWLEEATEYPVDDVMKQVNEKVRTSHHPLRELAQQIDPNLAKLSEKNLAIIENQLQFMEKKMKNFIRQTHSHTLAKFTETGDWLSPLNRPQERIFHPILLMNVIGEDGFRRLLSTDMSVNHLHKVVYL